MAGEVRVGIAGWTYEPWRGTFYPEGTAQKDELRYASRAVRMIEINGTFYSLQKPESFERWAAETPDDFVFSVKAPRFITHILRLKEAATPVANFIASGLLKLGPKLGPILWQLPPHLKFDADRIEAFLALLPHDTEAAAAVAERHDGKMAGRAWTTTDLKRPFRHTMEIRNKSFRDPRFIELLRKYGVALVCGDGIEWPRLMDVCSDFFYCRLHGAEELYANGYDDGALAEWRERIVAWAEGREPADAERVIDAPGPKAAARDVYVCFDNDVKVKAPVDAQRLAALVKQRLGR